MLLELFPFEILNNAMAFIHAYFISDFLRFDMSLLLLTEHYPAGYLITVISGRLDRPLSKCLCYIHF